MNQDISFPIHPSFAVQPLPAQGHVVTNNGAVLNAETAFALAAGDAEKDNVNAMMALANFYERGLGAPRNFAKAFEWYGKAAKTGLADANYALGVCYEIGMGNPGDMEKAMIAFDKAAEKGSGPAMLKLASLYIAGNRIPQDAEKGLLWLNRAVEAGLPDAQNTLGAILLHGLLGQAIDEKRALEYFKKAVDAGNLAAIRNISIICLNGIDGRKSVAAALKWFLIAAKSGYYMEDIRPAMEEAKQELTPEQIQSAEAQSDQWINDFREKRTAVAGRPGQAAPRT